MRGVVVKCSRERVRLATDEEWLGAELIKHLQDDMRAKLTRSGERGYIDIDNEPLPDDTEPEPPDTNIQHGVSGDSNDHDPDGNDENFSPTDTVQDVGVPSDQEAGRLSHPPAGADSDTDTVGEPEDAEQEAMETDGLPDDDHSAASTRVPTSVLARQTPVSSTVGLLPQRRELEAGEEPRGSRPRTGQTPSSSSGQGRPIAPLSAAPPGGWAAAEVRNRAINAPGTITEADHDSVDLLARAYFNSGKESYYISKMDVLPGTHPKMTKAQAHVFFQEEQKISKQGKKFSTSKACIAFDDETKQLWVMLAKAADGTIKYKDLTFAEQKQFDAARAKEMEALFELGAYRIMSLKNLETSEEHIQSTY